MKPMINTRLVILPTDELLPGIPGHCGQLRIHLSLFTTYRPHQPKSHVNLNDQSIQPLSLLLEAVADC